MGKNGFPSPRNTCDVESCFNVQPVAPGMDWFRSTGIGRGITVLFISAGDGNKIVGLLRRKDIVTGWNCDRTQAENIGP